MLWYSGFENELLNYGILHLKHIGSIKICGAQTKEDIGYASLQFSAQLCGAVAFPLPTICVLQFVI
jgi:hypothetical protein